MAAREGAVTLYKNLLTEIRRTHPKNVSESSVYNYIRDQFRRFQVTGERTCKASNEVQHLGETYLCLLQSSRKFEELNMHYKGRGERSIRDSARLVGLAIPGDDIMDK